MTKQIPTAQIRVSVGSLKQDETILPHTFINITDPDGRQIEYGLVPKEENTVSGEGHIDRTGPGSLKPPHQRNPDYDAMVR